MTTDRVNVHHQGAGAPTDNFSVMGKAKYSILIGATMYALRYSPEQSFDTEESGIEVMLQLGYTGNRDVYALTDSDLELTRRAMTAARAAGWVTARTIVTPHNHWENTACPGLNVLKRWSEVVAACQAPQIIPPRTGGVVGLRVADPARPGTPAGRTRFAQLVPGHGVAMVNGASVQGDTGPTPFGNWLLLGDAAKDIAEELVAVPGGFIVALTDGGTFGPYYFRD